MISNPVDLFSEYALLNVPNCVVEPGGYFTVTAQSPGTFPLTLCVSADGVTFAPQTFTASGQAIVSVGTDNPYIDFSGGCPGGPGPFTGNYVVVAYNLPAADGCVAQAKAFTLWMVNNQVLITRTDKACMYEGFGDNPSDQTEFAPDVDMLPDYITPSYDIKIKVERRDIEPSLNECAGSDALVYDTFTVVGQDIASYTTNGSITGPVLTHSIEATDLINIGGSLQQIKIAGAGMVNLGTVRTGTMNQFITDIRTDLNNALSGNKYMLIVQNASNRVRITMTCANGSPWVGIDKTDGFMSWCTTSTCPGSLNSTTVVTQAISGSFEKFHSPYETPCGDFINLYTSLCPDRDVSEIIDAANSNYNSITLINEAGRRYYIYDKSAPLEPNKRQVICHAVEALISGSGCATPPGPPVYSWQGGGSNPKEIAPLSEEIAESDCGGCVAERPFCFPEASDGGHTFGIDSLACSTGSSTTLIQNIAAMIEDCDGNDGTGMTLDSLTVHDVPAAFTSCTPNAATQRITSVHPANILPRTYYYAYQFNEAGEEKSNYALVRVDITPGSCCPA